MKRTPQKQKALSKRKAFCSSMGDAYPTIEGHVYLGRGISPFVRRRAKIAGLKPVNKAQFRKLLIEQTTVQRMLYSGTWHDTVVY